MDHRLILLFVLISVTLQQISYKAANLQVKAPISISLPKKPLVFQAIDLSSRGGPTVWSRIFNSLPTPTISCKKGYTLNNYRCISRIIQDKTIPSPNIPSGRLLQTVMDPIRDKIWPWYSMPIGSQINSSITQNGSQVASET